VQVRLGHELEEMLREKFYVLLMMDGVSPHTFICIYSYFPTIWYVKIWVINLLIFLQFLYKSLLKFPPKFRQSLPYTRRSQVIDIYPIYISNISLLITQSRPNHSGS